MNETCGPSEKRRRKLYLVARELGLTREERLDLSCYFLRRDITSWKQLDEDQINRLLDLFEGYHLIGQVFEQRSNEEPL